MSAKSQGPIWAKRTQKLDPQLVERNLRYCAGRDVAERPAADSVLVPHDIWTNRVHCRMLARQGIINDATLKKILRGLAQLEKAWQRGESELDPLLEDVHMNVERYVAETQGEAAAGAMHTARSRNDQSATDVRLWLRDVLLEQTQALCATVESLLKFARREAATICLGWTHGQPAMPTTLGHWAVAHAAGLARDVQALAALWPLINQSPLGAAASFGTSWPVDRVWAAKQLGFDAPQTNSLDAISTRWEAEARLGSVLSIAMTHLSSLGQDLYKLSSPPAPVLRLSDAHVTGSSIMPQKRNPDFAEVTRARTVSVHGLLGQLMSVGCGALSGYNRDTQWTKYWIMDLVDEVGEAPQLFAEVIDEMQVDRKAMAAGANAGFSLAADFADFLARTRKIPFRTAYRVVGEATMRDEARGWYALETLNEILKREKIKPLMTQEEVDATGNVAHVLAERKSLGGPSPEEVKRQIASYQTLLRDTKRWAIKEQQRLAKLRA